MNIGDVLSGGTVFYTWDSGDSGLIAAQNDIFGSYQWGCPNILIGTSSDIGSGSGNTVNIINGCHVSNISAKICSDLTLSGYTDWFLPSLNELREMYKQRTIIGGFELNESNEPMSIYWSSTEQGNLVDMVHTINFVNGWEHILWKNAWSYVRPIRMINSNFQG